MRYRRIAVRQAARLEWSSLRQLGDPWARVPTVVLARAHWRPPADVYETETELVVRAELAGVRDEEVEVTLYDDLLTVEGTRGGVAPPEDARFHVMEIRYGPFRLDVPVPEDADRERVSARFDLGFLVVTMPKMPGGPR